MKRVLCIWIPRWPIQRLAIARSELEDGPAADRRCLEKLAETCRQFSPVVALDDSSAPESLLLDVTGLAHLFGGEASLASEVVREFSRRKLAVRVAVADTVGAAWAVARFARGKAEGGRRKREGSGLFMKKVQGSAENRGGEGMIRRTNPFPSLPLRLPPSAFRLPPFFIVPPNETTAVLRPLPIEGLRLADEIVGVLHQLGIYQIGELEPLSRGDLAMRFGAQLVRRLDQATGQLAEPLGKGDCKLPPKRIARWDLEHPTVFIQKAQIEQILEQLIGRLAEGLARDGQGAVQLACRLVCDRKSGVDLSVGLFRPTASAAHLFGLVRTRLDGQRILLPGTAGQGTDRRLVPEHGRLVTAVEVEVTVAAPLASGQQALFSDRRRQEFPRELATLVDRLTSRLGRRVVVRPKLRPEAQPELACRYEPLVDGPSRKRRRCGKGDSPIFVDTKIGTVPRGPAWAGVRDLPPRPLRLFERPAALVVVVSIVPDGPPLRFRLDAREHRVAWIWGPERIETGWWRGRAIGRDYYRIETTSGTRYWLFRRLRDGKWFLHGAFE